ncbi:Glycine receptor subunit alphaZ1 [Nymphon striatum]|nr:Glycine receptor subunit alphaZ1 [Nymphon striatum]
MRYHNCLMFEESSEEEYENVTNSISFKILPKNYLKEVIPENDGLPLQVTYSILILDVNSINPVDMDWRLDFLITERWKDNRLEPSVFLNSVSYTNDYVRLPPSFKTKIWQPDPFIMNAKKFEIIKMKSNFESISLFSDKRVVYRGRFAAIMSCQMSFANFPNDIQVCPIDIISYGFTSDRLVLKWDSKHAIEVTENLKLLQYEMERPIKVQTDEINSPFYGRKSSRIRATVVFSRQLKYYVIQTFIPSILVVCLTWLSFWFGLDATPGRVMLCVTSLLTLTTMFQGLKSPPVSYIKAIDIWMISCMVFVFGTLLEFAIILHISGKRREQTEEKTSRVNPTDRPTPIAAWTTTNDANDNKSNSEKPLTKDEPSDIYHNSRTESINEMVAKIDVYSRYIFPIAFFLFSSIYWYYLSTRKF